MCVIEKLKKIKAPPNINKVKPWIDLVMVFNLVFSKAMNTEVKVAARLTKTKLNPAKYINSFGTVGGEEKKDTNKTAKKANREKTILREIIDEINS